MCYRKAHSSNVWEYAPIAKTLAELSMDTITRESIKRKLDITYMILKEKTGCSLFASFQGNTLICVLVTIMTKFVLPLLNII